jgi:hypothetical protein
MHAPSIVDMAQRTFGAAQLTGTWASRLGAIALMSAATSCGGAEPAAQPPAMEDVREVWKLAPATSAWDEKKPCEVYGEAGHAWGQTLPDSHGEPLVSIKGAKLHYFYWSPFGNLATVDVVAEGASIRAEVDVTRASFVAAKDYLLAAGHVGLPRGLPIHALSGGVSGMVVRAPLPFDRPRWVETIVPCSGVEAADPAQFPPAAVPAVSPYAILSREPLERLAYPGGPRVVAFRPQAPGAFGFLFLEQAPGFVHVRGAFTGEDFVATAMVDGWVATANVTRQTAYTFDRGSSAMADETDRFCPDELPWVKLRPDLRRARIVLGEMPDRGVAAEGMVWHVGNSARGESPEGYEVLGQSGDWLRFAFVRSRLAVPKLGSPLRPGQSAPAERAFWIRRADVVPHCGEQECQCPPGSGVAP